MIFQNWLSSLRQGLFLSDVGFSLVHTRRRRLHTGGTIERLESRTVLTTIDLGNLGSAGSIIFGAASGDTSGRSVSSAGDVNGDGFDDVLIGAFGADVYGSTRSEAGESYLIFGRPELTSTIAPDVTFRGAGTSDLSGLSVSSAGDVNGDGFGDVLIGAQGGDGFGNGKYNAGESYLVFGSPMLPSTFDLGSLGASGVTIFGVDVQDSSGSAVSGAGDVNGDGFDDLLIGAMHADSIDNARMGAGESYVIFGSASMPTSIHLANLGTAGITLFGSGDGDSSGRAVSRAGDVNGDGFDDILIGAYFADADGTGRRDSGEGYLVFGGSSLPASLDLSTLGAAGIKISGADFNDLTGTSVNAAGDVNGDGFDDFLIGAFLSASQNGETSYAGRSHVIFGGAVLPEIIDLANLSAVGITLYGRDRLDRSGRSVSSAGDINGDGFDDLLVGAYGASGADNLKTAAGESYLIFGGNSLPASIELSDLGPAGIVLFGVDEDDWSGLSVSGSGDVNGDGFDDFLIGASYGDAAANGVLNAGESYLIFGSDTFTSSVQHLGTSAGEMLTGDSSTNVINGASGNDTLIGNGGSDVLYGGEGNDLLSIADTTFQRLDGGNGADTLRIDGSDIVLDLTTLADNRLTSIETIDLRDRGANSLTLDLLEVLKITAGSNPAHTANTLTIRRDSEDTIDIGTNWSQGTNESVEGTQFQVFTQGPAKLLLEIPALFTATLTSDRIEIRAPQGAAVDIVVTRDAGTQEFVVSSRTGNVATTEFRFPISAVTAGLHATLSPQADRFDASLAGLPVTVNGGEGNDSLAGGTANDQLSGGNGDDTLTGGFGQDSLDAGAGGLDLLFEIFNADLTLTQSKLTVETNGNTVLDSLSGFEKGLLLGGGSPNRMDASLAGLPVTLFGGGGNDVMLGGNQADSLDGQGGNDTVTGGAGADFLLGGAGNDLLKEAFDQNITLTNSTVLAAGNGQATVTDKLTAFELADIGGGLSRNRIDLSGFTASLGATISGNGQSDTIIGSPGPDMIITLTGADVINGLGGADVVFSGSGNDTISGGDGFDNVSGQNGDDLVSGDGGNDVLVGGAGRDTLNGGSDNDFLSGQTDPGLLNGGDGNDILQGSTANDTLNGDAGDDRLLGLQNDDVLNGGIGVDTLFGGIGNDMLTGGAGADDLRGEAGSDSIDGGADADRINEVLDTNVTIAGTAAASSITALNMGTDAITNVERINLTGGVAANFFDARNANLPVLLIGDLGNDTLLGGSKPDILNGGDGDDVLSSGASSDVIEGGAGNDYFYEKADTDFVAFGLNVESTITGIDIPTNVEHFVMIGGAGANKLDAELVFVPVILIGGGGNDTLVGGREADFLIGGSRNDSTVAGSDGTDSLDGGNATDVLEEDPVDIKVVGPEDTTASNVFAFLPSWIDAL